MRADVDERARPVQAKVEIQFVHATLSGDAA
jgi:hypothetical protein